MGAIDITPPPELFIHKIDLVERQSGVGRDASGAPVENWTATYTNLVCTVRLRPSSNRESFGQQVQDFNAKVWFTQLPDGTLPQINERDRLTYGVWPGTSKPRYIIAAEFNDPVQNGTIMIITGSARAPA